MKKFILISFILPSLIWGCGQQDAPAEAIQAVDLAIVDARIWTGEPSMPWASALAVRGNVIALVGTAAEVEALIGSDTEVIRSPGGLVVPGFIDSHVHLLPSGFELSAVQLRNAPTPEEFTRRIGEFAAGLEPGAWITGGTWDHHNWGGELPHRDWIDAVTPDNPVMVVRLDGHMVLANSLALELAGVDSTTENVPGGEIVRDADGAPTGVLKDNAMGLVEQVIPAPTAEQRDNALLAAMTYLASHGVTTVHDMSYDWEGLATYRRLHGRGELETRIYANVPIATWEEMAAEVDAHGVGDEWLRIGGVKGFMDGSLGSHTAAFFADFTDTPGERGFFITEPADMQLMALAADARGLQLNIHAIGDRANAALLDIFDAVAQQNGKRDRRSRIEHAQHLRPQEISRIATTGVIPSMQPYHAIDDGRWADKVIGAERARYTYAFRSLLDAGARLAFGSDWSVAPAEPLAGIHAATTRRTLDGAHPGGWVPEEKITVEEALAAYTRNGAYASFEEGIKGTLAPGKLADMVLLDQDITRIAVEDIPETSVVRTIVDGVTVYRR
jgi:predicted amidohydrolase YtcJ